MNEYVRYISELLEGVNYLLGKELNEKVKSRFNFKTPGYERKVVQRAVETGKIHSSSPVSFGTGQFVYMHSDKNLNKEMILKITKEHRPPLYRIILMLDYYEGVLPIYEALKLAAVPLDKGKNKSDSIEKLIKELKDLKLGQEVTSRTGVKFIVHPTLVNDCSDQIDFHNNRMSIDTVFIPDILKSLRSFNIIDNDKLLYRNKTSPSVGISHNNFVWDAIAYTRTTGINEIKSSEADDFTKQTLVVLDIVISRKYTDEDLQGFFARIRSIINAVKTGKRKVLPIIIYKDTESKILVNRIHKLGFLCFDLGTIYGSKIYQIIDNLFSIKQDVVQHPNEIQSLIATTLSTIRKSGQEDNLNSIKGDLFESLMFPVVQLLFPNSNIDQGKKLKKKTGDKEEKYEYDYIIDSSRLQEIIVVELKGYSSSNYISLGDSDTKNTVGWFFRKTFPFAAKQLKAQNPNYKITGCYITTSTFKEDGVKFLEETNKGKLKPTSLDCWYDGVKLLTLLNGLKLKKTKEIITKYYIKKEDDRIRITKAVKQPVVRTTDDMLPF